MSKIYKLSLKQKSGLLTPLHSDTIFGHFCWRLLEADGENTLTEFLELYKEDKPVFTISNGLLEVNGELLFPKPLKLPPYVPKAVSKKEKVKNFIINKELKGRSQITVDELNLYLNNNMNDFRDSFANNKQLEIPKVHSDLRISVQIDRETNRAMDGQLFSYSPSYLNDNNNKTNHALLIKIIDEAAFESFNSEAILKSIFQLGYGKKKSSGYGEFKILSFEKYDKIAEPSNANAFMNLSNYLPAENDKIVDGFFETSLKYGKLGENYSNSENPFKNPILFMKEGSLFSTTTNKDFYGRITKHSEINSVKPDTFQCGFSFSLKALIKD
jgi:CRISPR-associated protein Csm4